MRPDQFFGGAPKLMGGGSSVEGACNSIVTLLGSTLLTLSRLPVTMPGKKGLKRRVFRTAPEDTAIGDPFDADLRGMSPARHSGKRATLW